MRDIRRSHLLLVCLASLAGGCAIGRVAHVAPDESRPHVTWEIREGGSAGDDRYVCGSTEPSRSCALAASTDQRSTEATVRLFLHAADTETNYLGQMKTAFLERAAKDRELSITVPADSQPVLSMVAGRVTTTPGAYSFEITLDGRQAGNPAPLRITEQIPVVVNGPSASAPRSRPSLFDSRPSPTDNASPEL